MAYLKTNYMCAYPTINPLSHYPTIVRKKNSSFVAEREIIMSLR